MASSSSSPLPQLLLLLQLTLLLSSPVQSADEEENLLQGINKYRTSLNLSVLSENKNAHCFAGELADQFKSQPCTNTTGADTVPGTETQFSNYPDLLSKCNLDIMNTRDGVIMPACVPNLVPDIVLSNFTESQYSQSLNDTKYTGAGIGSEDNWIIVVLTTNTPPGSFAPGTSAAVAPKIVFTSHLLSVLLGVFLVLLS